MNTWIDNDIIQLLKGYRVVVKIALQDKLSAIDGSAICMEFMRAILVFTG
jgi:hypothetical protein